MKVFNRHMARGRLTGVALGVGCGIASCGGAVGHGSGTEAGTSDTSVLVDSDAGAQSDAAEPCVCLQVVGEVEPLLDAGPSGEGDAPTLPPGSFMCGLNIGPFDGGPEAGEPWRWCMPPESCVPFNGGWACCTSQPSGGLTTCVAPVANDDG